MTIFKSRQIRMASVLLCTMLIFFQLTPDRYIMKVHAEDADFEVEDDDDDCEVIYPDEDDEDDEDDVEDESDGTGVEWIGADDGGSKPAEIAALEGIAPKDREPEHRKRTCKISKKNSKYHEELEVGDELKLTIKLKKKKINNKKIKFSSSKKNVATVSKSGVITAKGEGTTKIKISNKKNKHEKCTLTITVTDDSVSAVLDKTH